MTREKRQKRVSNNFIFVEASLTWTMKVHSDTESEDEADTPRKKPNKRAHVFPDVSFIHIFYASI